MPPRDEPRTATGFRERDQTSRREGCFHGLSRLEERQIGRIFQDSPAMGAAFGKNELRTARDWRFFSTTHAAPRRVLQDMSAPS
jgi:hypothetical protein